MRRTIIRALIGSAIFLCPLAVEAQQPSFNFLGQQFSTSIAAANNFQNPSQLPQATGRQACEMQYTGTATSDTTSIGFVFFGPSAPTATGSAFQVTNRGFINCETTTTEVDGNAVWLSSNATGANFVIKVK